MINNNYFKIPNDVFSLNLKPNQFVVLAYLLRHTNNNSKAFPSYQTIADNCNITRVTVINVVKQLIEQELIIKEIRKIPPSEDNKVSNETNVYSITEKVFKNCKEESLLNDSNGVIPLKGQTHIKDFSNSKINSSRSKLKFNNFEPREYDYDDLERKLLGWD
ncbi:putative transcriptional regulator [Clostridium saccharobutylicum]|uniref:Helix-turn-helix domain protein n=1 Tax=Clostridium saccharobutylicum DSM 13864 TaxID=1345695 RepID=U5MW25_CLOSA|nr:helix-turn-helix domain protein [Clostridium saccharobutylicum DSM 13864]AQR90945.1 hypothetical protein CLOSC_26660 [Clostridium saccharobutylicum]AQS00849.1 hypothetical protein CSACC_26730 [Clostridium saccharobutylicum]AQS14832.1 hypothetical protein CLOSACC_26730 [Clostridium saccharobutylicum]MBA2907125.1 putative transcriptional regulator [Clostridium saccharobutylicum]